LIRAVHIQGAAGFVGHEFFCSTTLVRGEAGSLYIPEFSSAPNARNGAFSFSTMTGIFVSRAFEGA
jgi:hypothetical protein